MYLEKIKSPKSLKRISIKDLPVLCREIRESLIDRISRIGGHLGPNLGAVELEVALHYVFNSPIDKFIFDVSHQCYTHKILTGRKEAFMDPTRYNEANGFTNPQESVHDYFTVGHTSTSLSLGSGLIKARDMKKEDGNVIMIIGDGSLSGGEAYEGLNNIIELGTKSIIIVNDNEMSMCENKGGYYHHLSELRNTKGKAKNNIFKALGYEYHYLEEGNDVSKLIKLFKKYKNIDHPVVLHIHTLKGNGYEIAINNKEKFHVGAPFNKETGEALNKPNGENYSAITYNFLKEKIEKDKDVVMVMSATPAILSTNKEKREVLGENFVDVGITEEHAVAFTGAMAKGGLKPVYSVFASFIQRSFDQLHEDFALDNNPGVICVFPRPGKTACNATHNGLYDIAEISNIPNIIYYAPTSKEEYLYVLDEAIKNTTNSIAIRVPRVVEYSKYDNFSLNPEIIINGKDISIIPVGSMMSLGYEIFDELKVNGYNPTLVNPMNLSYLDEDFYNNLSKNHKLIITIEEGILDGGFGQKVSSFYSDKDIYVKNFGLKKSFFGDFDNDTLFKDNGLTKDNIVNYIIHKI